MKVVYHRLMSLIYLEIAHHQKTTKGWAIWMEKSIIELSKALTGEN